MGTTPREDAESRSREDVQAFYRATEDIEENTDLVINGLLGIAKATDETYAVECTFSQRFNLQDFGTVMGTLLGTHAAQHGWTSEQVSAFLLKIVSNRLSSADTAEIVFERVSREDEPEA